MLALDRPIRRETEGEFVGVVFALRRVCSKSAARSWGSRCVMSVAYGGSSVGGPGKGGH
jgi:hypothetical protein